MPLSKFSKTFDIKEQSKGFFPHNFNIPINQNYVGLYPDKSFYQPEFFMNDQKEEFDKWYANQSNKLFDFKHELVKYCISDVKLLKEGCSAFRKIIMTLTNGICPFQNAITIASLCHFIYRKNIM